MANASSRLGRIIRIVGRYRLDALLEPLFPPRYRKLLLISPFRLAGSADAPRGERLRLALEELGPVFIKFGQMMSTRRDLLPADIAQSLAKLQDQVPPFDADAARALVEQALAAPIETVFSEFEHDALASASVAQVHAGKLRDGEDIVVKVIRPDIEPVIREDVALLRWLADKLNRYSQIARRLHLPEVVDDYEATILNELDLRREADNTQQLRLNFAGSPTLYVPRVYHDLCRRNVLVIERIRGIPIGDVDALVAAGTNMKVLAERGVETFFKQVFVDNFFHADMHPGNIFVDVSDPESPKYIAIDCAIIGQLTEKDQDYLARNLLAFFNRDYAEVASLHLQSGWIPADTDVEAFEAIIKELCEPIFAKPLSEISFGHFVVDLFQTAQDFGMEIQPQLVLLQKTLLNIEGLGRQLYPELDLWETAAPFMQTWMNERAGPNAAIKALSDNGPALLGALPRLPELIISASRDTGRLDRLTSELRRSSAELKALQQRQKRSRNSLRIAGIAAVAGALALAASPALDIAQRHLDSPGSIIALLCFAVASIALLRA
ncbi:MAG: ubiquinone biosynthesis regulatory protein kinase UbiB [Pseudomonadaceae bacterium]|nr:ubiquinone biosynthesis regulatory protein kinase UbiB [Pseudomonadaceae bacterium]